MNHERDFATEVIAEEALAGSMYRVECYGELPSTNRALLARAEEDAGLCLVAASQSAGVGRLGRSFYSPEGTGLYMSILFKPGKGSVWNGGSLTAMAGVAVCRALEKMGVRPSIKWVNDVYVDGRKVCGILAQSSIEGGHGEMRHIVLGIGVNLTAPKGGFPEELSEIAGGAFPQVREGQREELLVGILRQIESLYRKETTKEVLEQYRQRLRYVGETVTAKGENVTILGVDEDFGLVVRCENGELRTLRSGEVSIRK